jgi:uncharacterized protein YaiE (UPF0345 family)
MNLATTQLKDTYGNLLTIGTTAGSPTTGTLQNGNGQDITSLELNSNSLSLNGTAPSIYLMESDTTDLNTRISSLGSQLQIRTINDAKSVNTIRLTLDHSSGDISFRDTSNNEAFYWDASTARLGLGTDSPSRVLHIEDSSVAAIQLENTSEADSFIDFMNPSRTFRVGYDDSTDLFKVAVTNFNDNSLVVNSSGNVGIGTASPIADSLTLYKATYPYYYAQNSSSGTNASDGFRWGLESNTEARIDVLENLPMTFRTNAQERMRIDSSGNVGMNAVPENSAGTWRNYQLGSLSMAGRANDSNPDAMFGTNFKFTTANAEQRISAHATSRIFFNDDVITFQNAGSGTAGSAISWSPRMTIDSSGNVGIGADLPTSYTNGTTLEIKGKTSTGAGLLKVTNANGTTSGAFYAGSSSLVLSAQTTHNLSLGTDNQTRMTIDTSGHVTVQDGGFLIIDTGAVGANPRLYFRQDDINATNFIEVDRGTNAMEFWNNGSERMRILSGGGITFNGDTASANALDDYEEGTWTPVLRGSATAGTYETTTASGFYTKVGRMVTITARVILASSITGGGTGYAQVTGVPFAKGDDMAPSGSVLLRGVDIDNAGLYANVEFTTASAGSVLYFPVIKDNAFTADTQISGFSASDSFNFSITYFT